MNLSKKILLSLAGLVVAFAGYEGFRVLQARAQTPELIQTILAKADPQIAQIPQKRLDMLVRVEDPTFWTNDGTDFDTPGAGATTITQGLGKNLYFDNFTPGFQKIELILMSKFALNKQASKQDILTAALASAYWGNDGKGPIYGISEAARRYYGRDVGKLTDMQYLSLIAMLPAPGNLDPVRHKTANAERVARIRYLLINKCAPRDWSDVMLDGCAVSG